MISRWGMMTIAVAAVFPQALMAEQIASNNRDSEIAELRMELREMKKRILKQEEFIEKMGSNYVEKIQKEEMAKLMEEIYEDAKVRPALPSWMENLNFFADLRLRYQHDSRTAKDRNRFRYRARFGFKKTWWDEQLEAGFRIATGSSDDNDSTNQTATGYYNKKHIWLDMAYARWKPNYIKGLSLTAGKMKNPFHTKTDVTWDGDINPEGIVLDYQAPLGEFVPYGQVGYWMLNESGGGTDVIMVSYSAGFNWDIAKSGVKWFLGGTFYDYDDMKLGVDGLPADLNSDFVNYEILELTTKVKWKMLKLPWEVFGTYVQNCADNYSAIRSGLAGLQSNDRYEDDNRAWAVGFKVGTNKKKGDWSLGWAYRYIGAFAVPDTVSGGFTDSDFGGGVNTQGHVFGGKYNLDKFLTLGAKVYVTEPIVGADGGNATTVQIDFIWKF